jgi:rSAM/selenodomain-associated transferase 2
VKLSIIIPTLNERHCIGRLIDRLLTADQSKMEIIVVDGGSTDGTVEFLQTKGIRVINSEPSRSKQMNLGAKVAQNEILYFIHADTLPPTSFLTDGINVITPEKPAACYKSKFESKILMLRLNAFFTNFYWLIGRGGDQSLFILKSTFNELGRYDETMVIMEEYPLIKTLLKNKQLTVLPKKILISTRKYENRGWLKVSRANTVAYRMFKKGASSEAMKKRYNEILGEVKPS